MVDEARTPEARILQRHPHVRRAALASAEFAAWRRELKHVDVDGETLYLRGGDMLRDDDQVIVEWARRSGLLSDADIDAALQQEGDEEGRAR